LRRRNYLFVLGILIGIVVFSGLNLGKKDQLTTINSSMDQNNSSNESFRDYEILPKTSDAKNFEIIETIFNDKLNQYDTEGYFFQSYEPSLQATYYALYILKAIDKLDDIDQSAIGEYIMSHYNPVTHIFMDRYTLRYLDTEITYYPLTNLFDLI